MLIRFSSGLHQADVISCDRKHRVDDRDLSRLGALRRHFTTARSPSEGHDLHLTLATCGLLWNVQFSSKSRAPSDGPDVSWKKSTIAVRSSRDRSPIEPRSRRDRAAIVKLSSWNHLHGIRWQPKETQDHDRRTIVARSRCDRGAIVGYFEANLRLIHLQIGADSARI